MQGEYASSWFYSIYFPFLTYVVYEHARHLLMNKMRQVEVLWIK